MIIAFTSLTPAGATFMDWSWHWLKGSESVWSYKKGWKPIMDNPIKGINAHGHPKNHPVGLDQWKIFLESAKDESNDVSFYPIIQNTDDNDKEFVDNVNWLIRQKVGVVIIKSSEELPIGFRRSGTQNQCDMFLQSNPDLDKDISMNKLRDIMSVRLVGQQKTWLKKIDMVFEKLHKDVYIVSGDDWTTKTEEVMVHLFKKYNVAIQKDRVAHWRQVVENWQDNYRQVSNFYYKDIPEIANKIVAGENMDITHLDLGFLEECLIMQFLMKSLGRRLILPDDNFPKNTKELNKFLK